MLHEVDNDFTSRKLDNETGFLLFWMVTFLVFREKWKCENLEFTQVPRTTVYVQNP